jgi:hypothetical protein
MKQRLIITAFVSIVFLCGLVYAETQTNLVSYNDICAKNCGIRRNTCEQGCYSNAGSKAGLCLEKCMMSSDNCVNRCYNRGSKKKGDWDRVRTGQ